MLLSLKQFLLIVMVGACHIATAQNRQRVIDSLDNLLQQSKADTNRARLWIMIGDKYEQVNDSISIDHYGKAIVLSEQLQYKWGEAVARQYLAEVYTRYNKYDSARMHLDKVMEVSRALKDPKRVGVAATAIGNIYARTGDLEAALEYFIIAAREFEKLPANLRIMLISAYSNIGGMFFELKQMEKSLQYMKQAFDIAEEVKNDIEIGYAACELAAALQRNGSAKEGKKYIDRAVSIANKEEDLLLKIIAWQYLGSAHLIDEKYHDALAAFNQALTFANKYGDSVRIAHLLQYTGRAQYYLQNYSAAEENLATALRYFSNVNDLKGLQTIYETLYALEVAKGNYKKGFEFLKLYHEHKDSLYNIDNSKSMNVLETKYQNEKKVKEIAELNVKKVEQELAIAERNRWLMGAILSLGLLTLFSIWYYKNSRQKIVIAKQNQVLQEEKINSLTQQQQVIALQSMVNGQETERTRIARDLHDSLGGMFSTVKMHFSTLQHEVPDLRSNMLYKKSYELVDGAAEELRKIAHNMMPDVLLKMGLIPALRDFCNNVNAGKMLQVSLQAYGMEERLNASTEVMVYRIIQELVNNIMKHAQATQAIIQFNREGNNLSITVEDNGRGFDTQQAEEKRGIGIQTVKSRVIYLNGRLSIDSRDNVGTTVMIDLLLNEEA